MPQYCDSETLERNWFFWILAKSVPELESFREQGLLWTKITGMATNKDGSLIYRHGQTLPDPSSPKRIHCIALSCPIHFSSNRGRIPEFGKAYFNETPTQFKLTSLREELNLLSASRLHNLDALFEQSSEVIPRLQQTKYIKEIPANISWHAILDDINKMCQGIAKRFNPRSEEEHLELAHEALLQVTNKLVNQKLVYTPGRAPVFNLLTTTIHRCLYSFLNRRKQQREGHARLLANIQAGTTPPHRSLRHARSHIRSH